MENALKPPLPRNGPRLSLVADPRRSPHPRDRPVPTRASPALEPEDLLVEYGNTVALETLRSPSSVGPSEPEGLFSLFLEVWDEPAAALELDLEAGGDGTARISLRSPASSAGDECWERIGFLQRGLELLGARSVLVTETTCRAEGADACVHLCEWSMDA